MNTFSFDTVQDFDKHIELSIPNYTHINELIQSMSNWFVKEDTNVYDIGCSTGKLIERISMQNMSKNINFYGYDKSKNMERKSPWFDFKLGDITKPYETPIEIASLVMSIFTLQFLTIQERWDICKRIYDGLKPGGAFIVCEKVYMKEGIMQDIFTFSYYDYKQKSFSEKEILDKQKDLRKIMSPITEDQNKVMFREAGFTTVDTFFSSLMFKGWLMIK